MPLAGQHESSSDPYGFYSDAKQAWAEQEDIHVAQALCAANLLDYACHDKRRSIPLRSIDRLVGLWPPTCGWWLATLARGVNDQWTQVLLTLILDMDDIH